MAGKKTLLIVDVQNDFCPGGALGIDGGDKIIPVINRYIEFFREKGLPVIFTRDWHPDKTSHFRKFGGVWPEHCVQDTIGSQFNPDLDLPEDPVIVSKGMDPDKDSYSAFHAFDPSGVPLSDLLKKMGVKEIYIAGLATDYCVKETTLSATKEGFRVNVLKDAIKGVDLEEGDSARAIEAMEKAGARMVTLDKLAKELA